MTPSQINIRLNTLESSLRDLNRKDLAGYKQPGRFEFRQNMPLGPAGRILKRELKAEYN